MNGKLRITFICDQWLTALSLPRLTAEPFTHNLWIRRNISHSNEWSTHWNMLSDGFFACFHRYSPLAKPIFVGIRAPCLQGVLHCIQGYHWQDLYEMNLFEMNELLESLGFPTWWPSPKMKKSIRQQDQLTTNSICLRERISQWIQSPRVSTNKVIERRLPQRRLIENYEVLTALLARREVGDPRHAEGWRLYVCPWFNIIVIPFNSFDPPLIHITLLLYHFMT